MLDITMKPSEFKKELLKLIEENKLVDGTIGILSDKVLLEAYFEQVKINLQILMQELKGEVDINLFSDTFQMNEFFAIMMYSVNKESPIEISVYVLRDDIKYRKLFSFNLTRPEVFALIQHAKRLRDEDDVEYVHVKNGIPMNVVLSCIYPSTLESRLFVTTLEKTMEQLREGVELEISIKDVYSGKVIY